MHLCFKVPKDEITVDGSRSICVEIPFLIPLWNLFNPNPPDPLGPIESWITGAQIDVKQARDLSVLAAVHELVGQLSPQIQGVLEAPVKQAFKTIELPKFATLSFDRQVEKEYK